MAESILDEFDPERLPLQERPGLAKRLKAKRLNDAQARERSYAQPLWKRQLKSEKASTTRRQK